MKKNAGYEIILEIDCKTCKMVLGKADNPNMPSQYVTWEWTKQGGYYWGHYHGNYLKALRDLALRVEEEVNFILAETI